jgi:hypothetical protein
MKHFSGIYLAMAPAPLDARMAEVGPLSKLQRLAWRHAAGPGGQPAVAGEIGEGARFR